MSNAPYVTTNKARWGLRMGDNKLIDEMIKDGLWDAFNNYHMGITAENVAERFNVTRQDQDEVGVASHIKLLKPLRAVLSKKKLFLLPLKVKRRCSC